MTTSLRTLLHTLFAAFALLLAFAGTSHAQNNSPSAADATRKDIEKTLGFVPRFFAAMPDSVLPGAWDEMKGLQLNPSTALSGRTKELIGLAVAAQVPCHYCVYAHTEFAKLNGASDAELGEATAVGGLERHWSAYFYGLQLDEATYKSDLARIIDNVKKAASRKPSAAPTAVPTDTKSTLADIERSLGFVPTFLSKLPEAALPGAWRELKELKLSSSTRLSGKDKSLISLAVASQVPSHACIVADTEFAKLAGASEREIAEAVGMAAITRNMSTLLNGMQTDDNAFRADITRLVNGAKAAQKKAAVATRAH